MSQPAITGQTRFAIERFHGGLEDGEKVLMLGEGKIVDRSVTSGFSRAVCFFLLPFFVLFCVPAISIWLWYCGWSFLIWLVPVPALVMAWCIYRPAAHGQEEARWHAVTSKRLIRIENDGSVKTLAQRAEIKRIEAEGDRVTMVLGEGRQRSIVIEEVRGLPEIVGGSCVVSLGISWKGKRSEAQEQLKTENESYR